MLIHMSETNGVRHPQVRKNISTLAGTPSMQQLVRLNVQVAVHTLLFQFKQMDHLKKPIPSKP
jgi:hypothetical protein